MALAPTPPEFDPTGILAKQRQLYVILGVMREITAALLADMEEDEEEEPEVPEDPEPEEDPEGA